MDRIDTQAAKGMAPGLKVQSVTRLARPAQVQAEGAAEAGGVPVSSVASAGVEPPVDGERVAEIRRALEDGRYPLVPARIADAMIASGFMLRMRG